MKNLTIYKISGNKKDISEPQLWGMKKAATSKSLLPYQLEDGERTFYGIINSEVGSTVTMFHVSNQTVK